MILCELDVAGDPIPKGRPRQGRNGHTYTPKRTQDAEAALAWQMRSAYRGAPTGDPIEISIAFRCATRRRCDIDNLAKLVLDAGNKIVWQDDQQVVRLIVTVDRGDPEPGTSIIVSSVAR